MAADRYTLPPEVEEDRLRALAQLAVLDSPPEERFARITRIARQALGVPMASINLIARDRQWCKQFTGDTEVAINGPRDQSVCRATVARAYERRDDPVLILEDATQEPEFADLPAVGGDHGIRFYAGHPLFGPGDHPVGTFCVYDTRPRRLGPAQLETFRELAAWAQREIERSDDLDRAAYVQQRLLPHDLGELPGYRVAARCVPAYAVGGDFYDHYPVQQGAIFTLADVMGKGLGAAIMTAGVRSSLRAASRAMDRISAAPNLRSAVGSVAEQLAGDLDRTDTFVTLFHGRLDAPTGLLSYVDAGHGIAALAHPGGPVEQLPATDLPMGIAAPHGWTAHEVTLSPGDVLIVASDGLLDLLGDGTGMAAVLSFFARHPDPDDLCAAVAALAVDRPPADDVTVIAVRRNPVMPTEGEQ